MQWLKHTCTLCGSTEGYRPIVGLAEKLKEAGFPYALDAFETLNTMAYDCKNCGASDRDRLYKLYIEKTNAIGKKSKVLDFAPPQKLMEYIKSITKNHRSADLLIDSYDDKVDITDMKNYKNNTFDFFICSHVVEHVDDDKKALSELYRVLKPGGKGIVMTPILPLNGVQDEDPSVTDIDERWRRFAQDDHIRLYEKSVFLERLKAAGFKVHVYGFWNLNPLAFIRNAITFRSRLYVVEKQGQ